MQKKTLEFVNMKLQLSIKKMLFAIMAVELPNMRL